MSKTKEDILRCKNPQLDNTIEFYSQSLVVRDVIKAMDEYAQQAVQEYKEKLKAGIQAELDYYNGIALSEHGEGHLSGLKKAFDLL